MGEFEIDELGNFIIMRGDNGELLDKMDRMVNRRGYLVDRFGNVINKLGVIIFKVVELDIDDEIPAPFGFEKRKKNILKIGDETKFTIQNYPEVSGRVEDSVDVIDEGDLDREVRGIKEKSMISDLTKQTLSKQDLRALRENGQVDESFEIKAEVRQKADFNGDME